MSIADLTRPVGYVLGGGGSLGAVQVGMLQALGERDIPPDIVAGTSVGSLNGAVLALDPKSAANRLSHLWARMTRDRVFPGGLLAQARTLQHTRTHLFPSTGLATVISDFLGADLTFADLALPFATVTTDIATARPRWRRRAPVPPPAPLPWRLSRRWSWRSPAGPAFGSCRGRLRLDQRRVLTFERLGRAVLPAVGEGR